MTNDLKSRQESLSGLELPKWLADLDTFLSLKSQFLFTGNLHDKFLNPHASADEGLDSLSCCIWSHLKSRGYAMMIAYDPTDGIGPMDCVDEELAAWFWRTTGLGGQGNARAEVSLKQLHKALRSLVVQREQRVAFLLNYASRILIRGDHVEGEHLEFFTAMLKLSHEAKPCPNPALGTTSYNPVLWLAENEADLPSWFTSDNSRMRTIIVPEPDRATREKVIHRISPLLPEMGGLGEDDRDSVFNEFIDASHGLRCSDLLAIAHLAKRSGISAMQISDAARRYKVGIEQDPWRQLKDDNDIANGESVIAGRIKGQESAIRKAMDIVKRALTGLSAAQASKRGGRPRGVLFLAGPTGTGKTELAKSLTELIFGDEDAYIRFDMSEFSAEHADQRLLGAPPGYIGYDAGGELTNAIRQRPFSIVLFDEIEKAHPRILDKFLQMLDDGVLTSGRGERVYFSEAIIVFTSNLGITRKLPDGQRVANVKPNDPPGEVRKKVVDEITRYFREEINRPELLNRIGENIVVFDFIRSDVATLIFDKMIGGIVDRLSDDRGLQLRLAPDCRAALCERCTSNLDNGGRGIGNQIEALFINPLARGLFELPEYGRNRVVEVAGFREEGGIPLLDVRLSGEGSA